MKVLLDPAHATELKNYKEFSWASSLLQAILDDIQAFDAIFSPLFEQFGLPADIQPSHVMAKWQESVSTVILSLALPYPTMVSRADLGSYQMLCMPNPWDSVGALPDQRYIWVCFPYLGSALNLLMAVEASNAYMLSMLVGLLQAVANLLVPILRSLSSSGDEGTVASYVLVDAGHALEQALFGGILLHRGELPANYPDDPQPSALTYILHTADEDPNAIIRKLVPATTVNDTVGKLKKWWRRRHYLWWWCGEDSAFPGFGIHFDQLAVLDATLLINAPPDADLIHKCKVISETPKHAMRLTIEHELMRCGNAAKVLIDDELHLHLPTPTSC